MSSALTGHLQRSIAGICYKARITSSACDEMLGNRRGKALSSLVGNNKFMAVFSEREHKGSVI